VTCDDPNPRHLPSILFIKSRYCITYIGYIGAGVTCDDPNPRHLPSILFNITSDL